MKSVRPSRPRRGLLWSRLAAALSLLAGVAACRSSSTQPSLLIFVSDTTRVDAVSAYGTVKDTTPTMDALAASGLRYTHAYAQAPWTLPSHATLFTGLLPSQHGVGWQNLRAGDELTMLAERLRDAGYETAGVSENLWISEAFNMVQGFEQFSRTRPINPAAPTDEVVDFVRNWSRTRKKDRPFFLFVNVVDPHSPYSVRQTNPYLPATVTAEEAAAISQEPGDYFCASTPSTPALDVLWDLYLGDVGAADRKLALILAALREAGLDRNLVTVVTSDHGEHFGEHGLVSHQFSVHEELLHVPLIVHGLAGVTPAVVDTPVQLADIVPTVMGWLGLSLPPNLAGRPLPTDASPPAEVPLVTAEFYDIGPEAKNDANLITKILVSATDKLRQKCDSRDRVYGDMRSLIRSPLKLVWYADYPSELFDLSVDRREQHDLAAERPAIVAQFTAELEKLVARGPHHAPSGGGTLAVPADVQERLRALGYVDVPDKSDPR